MADSKNLITLLNDYVHGSGDERAEALSELNHMARIAKRYAEADESYQLLPTTIRAESLLERLLGSLRTGNDVHCARLLAVMPLSQKPAESRFPASF